MKRSEVTSKIKELENKIVELETQAAGEVDPAREQQIRFEIEALRYQKIQQQDRLIRMDMN